MSNGSKLPGRKALVTGADTGIGREIALEFARQGADVILHYSHHKDGATSAAEEIHSMGRRAEIFGADFHDLDQAFALASYAIKTLGSINCLINNAGVTFNRPFLKMEPEHFNKLFNINFRAQYFITQKIVGNMLEHGGGAICNLSSIHGLQGAPEHSAYAATKGAIIAYTRALGVELAHRGIRVNAIAPGWITVENYYKVIPGFTEAEAKKAAENAVPVARYGLPIDVARLATFLCGDDAGFLVGQTIVLDGGTVSLMSLISDFRSESASKFGEEYILGPKKR
jgi:NAD(P)-dependent dehydrogenase (short-subunit alcohol dehydrogenase family)